MVDALAQPLGDRLEVAAGEAAVGREALGEDRAGSGTRSASASSFIASQPPMFASGSFFALIVMPSASDAISRTMSATVRSRLPRLALADEPRVLGEPARVEEERHAEPVAERAHAAEVLERDRLAAAGVVRDR